MRRLLLPSLVALLLALAPSAHAAPRPLVSIYGDSLVLEAKPYFEPFLRDLGHVDSHLVAVGGTAPCDILPTMRDEGAHLHASLVILEFSGNTVSPCMHDGLGLPLRGQGVVDKYRADLIEAIKAFRPGAPQIWLATAPNTLTELAEHDDIQDRLNAMLRSLAADNHRVHVVAAGEAVLDHHQWTPTMPCLPKEPCQWGVDAHGDHVNKVRANDGGHFCPWGPTPMYAECPTYSSGAMRYALGLSIIPLRSRGWLDETAMRNSLAAGWVPPPPG